MLVALTIFSVVALNICNAQITDPIVTISDGQLRGFVQSSDTGTYYSFRGIPYAQPPLGELRFLPPQPLTPWDGIKNATKFGNKCWQGIGPLTMGNEDCLVLNVYAKQLPEEVANPVPVLLYIHGGAFISGAGDGYHPDYIFQHGDVVVVTINYRLTIFGFLTTQDDVVQGNAGLKDQVMALKWIQQNIAAFNGDPNRVIISGTSAGSGSVDYHMLSPLSKDLFHGAILQSGSALDPWALQRNSQFYLNNVANALGISADNSQELVAALQQVDAQLLMLTAVDTNKVGEWNILMSWPFMPVLENAHEGAFMTTSAYSLLSEGNYNKVPYMVGTMSGEGTYGQSYSDMGILDLEEHYSNITRFVPYSINDVDDPYLVGEIIRDYYFAESNVSDTAKFINYMTFEQYIRGIRKSIDLKRENDPEIPGYFYVISYKGGKTNIHDVAGHGEDVQWLWKLYPVNNAETDSDRLTRDRLITLWLNFIIHGNPTPSEDPLLENVVLPAITAEDVPVLYVNDHLTVIMNPNATDLTFWQNLFDEYGKPPYFTF